MVAGPFVPPCKAFSCVTELVFVFPSPGWRVGAGERANSQPSPRGHVVQKDDVQSACH